MKSNLVQINDNSVEFKEDGGKVYVSSRDIANVFGKEHKNIIRDIKALPYDNFSQLNFEPSNYIDSRGKKQPEYLLTRDGFSMLVMGFTGEKAYQWKVSFINAFNEMEKIIYGHAAHPQTSNEDRGLKLKELDIRNKEVDAELQRLSLLRYEQYNKLAERYRGNGAENYAQILDSYATKELTGEHILPLPELPEKYYTASEVGKMLGTNANMVGRIANKHKLKNEQYGKWFVDKAKYANKEVRTFQYNNAGIDIIRTKLILKDTNQ